MDLFDYMRSNTMKSEAPLASRMRPTTLDEIVGQQHIIGKDKLLYRAIRADKLRSVIFYGPPGTGKTTNSKSHCAYYQCRIYADQCNRGRQERYGGSGPTGEGQSWNVRKENHSFCG